MEISFRAVSRGGLRQRLAGLLERLRRRPAGEAAPAPPTPAVDLERNAVLRIVDGEGCVVACVCGEVWITQDRGSKDVFLSPHKQFPIEAPGLTLVHAMRPSVVRLWRPAAPLTPQRSRSAQRGDRREEPSEAARCG